MKMLVLNGNPEDNEVVQRVISIFERTASSRMWDLEIIQLRDYTMAYCRGCFGCLIQTPGECVIDDDIRQVTAKIIQSDLVVYFTPIIFGAYSPLLKNLLDRSLGLIHPYFIKINEEFHHKKRYAQYPHILGFGVLKQKDEEIEDLFHRNVCRNALNFHAPSNTAEFVYSHQSYDEIQITFDVALNRLEVV